MDLIDIVCVENFVKVESLLNHQKETNLFQRQKFLTEFEMMMSNWTDTSRPLEVIYQENNVATSISQSIIKTMEKHFELSIVTKTPSSFTLLCEASKEQRKQKRCVIRWDSEGITCFIIHGNEQFIKRYLTPISEKKTLKTLSTVEMKQAVGQFYGRPIEIEDILKFRKIEDLAAIDFIQDISDTFLEILAELKQKYPGQSYYLSKVFPLFQDESFIQELSQRVQTDLALKIN